VRTRVAQFWYGIAAPFYDQLRDLAYPQAKSLTFDLIHHLPMARNVLVIGGGTGEWLADLKIAQPEATIYFVELSRHMLNRAKRRTDDSTIHWVHQNAFHYTPEQPVNLIILPFFLDHFNSEEINQWIEHLESISTNNSSVAIVDFKSSEHQSDLTKLFAWAASTLLGLGHHSLTNVIQPFLLKDYHSIWETESQAFISSILQKQQSS